MKEEKIFINNDNRATYICPKCKKAGSLRLAGYDSIDGVIRLAHACECGYANTFLVERRKFYRKQVILPGLYVIGDDNVKHPIIVKDLSRGGLRFELLETEENLKVGDKLFVEFYLDDPHKTLIRKNVVIRNIQGDHIGAEFCLRKIGDVADKIIAIYTFE
jgi:hypothetical protein